MKMKPDAILFDMDGVLIDSLDAWWKSLNQALTAYNYEEITREVFVKYYWGHDLYDILEMKGLNPEIEKYCNKIYSRHINEIKIYTDTKETLVKLEKYRKAIITNTPHDCTKQILKRFDIKQFFPVVITCNDVRKAKPDPEAVFKACDSLKVSSKSVLLVGDTKSDVRAGRAAGSTTIGINIEADFTISKLSELTELVE